MELAGRRAGLAVRGGEVYYPGVPDLLAESKTVVISVEGGFILSGGGSRFLGSEAKRLSADADEVGRTTV